MSEHTVWRAAATKMACLAAIASLFAACTDGSVDRSGLHDPAPSASRDLAPSIAPSPAGPLSLVLRPSYEEGSTVPVKLRNDGDVGFEYNPDYEACFMTYLDEDGREFLVPEGTHCDLISTAVVEPGDTVTLFRWDLDECTKDEWGCLKERPLAPGSYTVKGRFRPVGGGEKVRVEATFEVTAP